MCGISGFIDFKKQSSLEILQEMTRTMVHRGPDGEGYFLDEKDKYILGFGHRRLSIIDLSSAGTQPMHFQHYSILLNGEIYNYAEIKQELIQLGHEFVSNSDTEVVLHAYIEYGNTFLEKLVGMFAILIYDAQKKEVFMCRDRVGVKPFYYYYHNGLFLFTSELKSFLKHPHFQKEINKAAVAKFMQLGYVPSPHCIFQYSHKLHQGHFALLNLETQQLEIKKYWAVEEFYNQPKLQISFQEAKEEMHKRMKKAFQYRMVADVPVGVFLSGGYDSSAVTAILQANSSEQLKTFTIGMPTKDLDEAPFAKQVAKHLGTDHHELYCTEQEALALIQDIPHYYDEPFGDSSALPTTLVSQLARKQVTVALSADAGDEIFAGYNRYDYVSKYVHQLGKIPSPFRKLGAGLMEVLPLHQIVKDPLIAQRYRKIKEIIKNPNADTLLQILTSEFYDNEVEQLVKGCGPLPLTGFDTTKIDLDKNGAIEQMMAIDFNTYLPDDIMQKVDRATMSTSLEGREPFLDQNIIEFAAQLPLEFKYKEGIKKYMLKEIVHEYLPQEMMDRPKAGFAIPVNKWLTSDLKDLVLHHLSKEKVRQYDLLDADQVTVMVSKLMNGRKEYTVKVWYALMLQMWADKYM
jgi:asparagine synthase (glutamine-hydrolysing)